jgi:hypothetical protein
MNSDQDTPKGVGCPIRTSTDQRLLAAPRGFSQRATSFFASWCQGIHRMPFSYSIPHGLGRDPRTCPGSSPGPPCTETILRRRLAPPPTRLLRYHHFAHHRMRRTLCAGRLLAQPAQHGVQHNPSHNASEPSPPMTGAASPSQDRITRSDRPSHSGPHLRRQVAVASSQTDVRQLMTGIWPLTWHTRPETHQNLIHTDKDQPHGARTHPEHCVQTSASTELEHSAIPPGMETTGIEPVTPCLQSRCSPS